jgi:hypothetical protein
MNKLIDINNDNKLYNQNNNYQSYNNDLKIQPESENKSGKSKNNKDELIKEPFKCTVKNKE